MFDVGGARELCCASGAPFHVSGEASPDTSQRDSATRADTIPILS
jgi:hypothetical protein